MSFYCSGVYQEHTGRDGPYGNERESSDSTQVSVMSDERTVIVPTLSLTEWWIQYPGLCHVWYVRHPDGRDLIRTSTLG